VDKYLNILSDTYIYYLLPPYFSNVRKEISKMPKIFSQDLGLKNYILDSFSTFQSSRDFGRHVENFVFAEIYHRRNIRQPYFWRTSAGAEVDLVLRHAEQFIPIECKYTFRAAGLSRSFNNFLKEYKCLYGVLVTSRIILRKSVRGVPIYYLPASLLPLVEI
jgi:predicted AAA+ superfamily ATPase